eukprot:1159340-Pelagomonas_calceolata.AAC.3
MCSLHSWAVPPVCNPTPSTECLMHCLDRASSVQSYFSHRVPDAFPRPFRPVCNPTPPTECLMHFLGHSAKCAILFLPLSVSKARRNVKAGKETRERKRQKEEQLSQLCQPKEAAFRAQTGCESTPQPTERGSINSKLSRN